MAIDPIPYLDPLTTAVVLCEVQENVIGDTPFLPGLAQSARANGMVENLRGLTTQARRVGSRVYYCLDTRRPDGFGTAENSFVHTRMTDDFKDQTYSVDHGSVVKGLEPKPEDIVINRMMGMTAFFTTPLNGYLHNTGVKTIVLAGASLNIGVVGSAIEAMNHGYRVIVPRDCVASDPPEYADQLLKYTIRNIALVTNAATITNYWASLNV